MGRILSGISLIFLAKSTACSPAQLITQFASIVNFSSALTCRVIPVEFETSISSTSELRLVIISFCCTSASRLNINSAASITPELGQ